MSKILTLTGDEKLTNFKNLITRISKPKVINSQPMTVTIIILIMTMMTVLINWDRILTIFSSILADYVTDSDSKSTHSCSFSNVSAQSPTASTRANTSPLELVTPDCTQAIHSHYVQALKPLHA